MYYEIRDQEEKVLISNLSSEYVGYAACPLGVHSKQLPSGATIRYGRSKNRNGSVFLFVTDGPALTSTTAFHEKLRTYLAFLDEVKSMRANLLNEMSHDIIDLAGRSAQEVISLLDQSILSQKPTYAAQLAYAEPIIRNSPDVAAEILLRIHKNSVLMNSIIVGLEAKYYNSLSLAFDTHTLRTVIANILLTFRRDFEKHGIEVILEPSPIRAYFDYRTFTAGLCPILENATKYAGRGSEINIHIRSQQGHAEVLFEMLSLQILPEESELIFTEGFSGASAKRTQKEGKGLGLYISRRLLELSQVNVSLETDPAVSQRIDGELYERNTFKISF